jgi:hypothetical protein
MANRQQRSNREAKKPKKEKIKVTAAEPKGRVVATDPVSRQEEIADISAGGRRLYVA